MPVRVGINGFGRMGRLALRAAFDNPQIQIVHINELKGGPETAAHLLEFDSVHGRWRVPIAAEAHGLKINGDRVGYSNFDAPGDSAVGRSRGRDRSRVFGQVPYSGGVGSRISSAVCAKWWWPHR